MNKYIRYLKHSLVALAATVLFLIGILILIVVGGLLMDERSSVEDGTGTSDETVLVSLDKGGMT